MKAVKRYALGCREKVASLIHANGFPRQQHTIGRRVITINNFIKNNTQITSVNIDMMREFHSQLSNRNTQYTAPAIPEFSTEDLKSILDEVEKRVYEHRLFSSIRQMPSSSEDEMFLKWGSISHVVNECYFDVLSKRYPSIFKAQSQNTFIADEGENHSNTMLQVVLFKNELYSRLENMYQVIRRMSINFGLSELNAFEHKLPDNEIESIYRDTFLVIMDEPNRPNENIYQLELNAIGQSGPNDLYQRNELTKPIIARAQYQVVSKKFETNPLSHWLHYRCSLEEWYHRAGCKDRELVDRTREFHDWCLDIISGKETKKANSKKFKVFILVLMAISLTVIGLAYFGLSSPTEQKVKKK
ncbi:hypothetical protein C9374_005444 [Naegleria lovaniensis]|uniref:Uncharacterized protein n=1 Tax=Naegleria lovaniensis TaxID=51637 RepID=A0AA88GPR4_NAELO|nr:uncharacterized protein C9374_005444 [Naegleria lovaniensis]KAG2382242.1 hypothetical protein C9374_005444 [Naegleria lovaniensis]